MTTSIDRIRVRALGRSPSPGRLVRMKTSTRDSALAVSRLLRDPGSRRHQRAAVRHLRRAARRTQRIGPARAIDDSRVKLQVAMGYRHLVAAKAAPRRRARRRLIAGGVLTGLVFGGAAAGIARTRSAPSESAGDAGGGEPNP
jgi:hypothetical protein